MAELRFTDLRFTPDECAELFQRLLKRPISDSLLKHLLDETEGWVTGLRLHALALEHQTSESEIAYSSIAQNDRQLLFAYLASEVLSHQPAFVQDFLLKTALLEQLNPSLCLEVTGYEPSAELLAQLERDNLFLAPLDMQHTWYHYHRLFADFLRNRIQHSEPACVPIVHTRAATWYIRHNLYAEAIHHLLASGETLQAAQLIERQGPIMLERDELGTPGAWLSSLPEALVLERPRLCVLAAWLLLHTSDSEPIERYLCAAELALQNSPDTAEYASLNGEIAAIRTRMAIYQDRIPESIELAQQALVLLPPEQERLRGEMALSLGTARQLGQTEVALTALREAIIWSYSCGNLRTALLAVRSLANLEARMGRLHVARRLYEDALARAHRASSADLSSFHRWVLCM